MIRSDNTGRGSEMSRLKEHVLRVRDRCGRCRRGRVCQRRCPDRAIWNARDNVVLVIRCRAGAITLFGFFDDTTAGLDLLRSVRYRKMALAIMGGLPVHVMGRPCAKDIRLLNHKHRKEDRRASGHGTRRTLHEPPITASRCRRVAPTLVSDSIGACQSQSTDVDAAIRHLIGSAGCRQSR